MHCAGCGTEIQSGLNYCSRCGRRVAEEVRSATNAWTNPLVIAGQTAGVGFFGFIFIILILTKSGTMPKLFVPITFFYFAALFGICFMILRYGSTASSTESSAAKVEPSSEAFYLRPATTAQLEEGRDFDVGSVTDARPGRSAKYGSATKGNLVSLVYLPSANTSFNMPAYSRIARSTTRNSCRASYRTSIGGGAASIVRLFIQAVTTRNIARPMSASEITPLMSLISNPAAACKFE